MPELTPADALGTGLSCTQHWDISTAAGSMELTSGLAILERDLAFALGRAAQEEDLRGRQYSPELREDTRILVRRVAAEFDRIASIDEITIIQPDDARQTAEVKLTVTAVTDERGEFVFTV